MTESKTAKALEAAIKLLRKNIFYMELPIYERQKCYKAVDQLEQALTAKDERTWSERNILADTMYLREFESKEGTIVWIIIPTSEITKLFKA